MKLWYTHTHTQTFGTSQLSLANMCNHNNNRTARWAGVRVFGVLACASSGAGATHELLGRERAEGWSGLGPNAQRKQDESTGSC